MKTLNYILMSLLFTTLAHAQSELEKELDERNVHLEETLRQQVEVTKRHLKLRDDEIKKLEQKKAELKNLETYEENFGQSRIIAIDEIGEKIKKLPLFQKLGSKASYYKCLRTSLEDKQFLNGKDCRTWHSPSLSSEEEELVQKWETSTGIRLADVARKKEALPKEIANIEGFIPTWDSNYKFSLAREDVIKSEIKTNEIQKKEYGLLPQHANLVNCNENTPTVNLELEEPFPGADFKGAYHGVPRDNQDGLGTCYANAAKNLLVGISKGDDVASFLDLALVYKNSNGSVSSSGLDAGNSCATLNAARKTGYCPQHFAPLEGGEKNSLGEGLFNLDQYNYLATNVNLLRDFLGDLSEFQKKSGPVTEEILARSKYIVDAIKNNPNIQLPVPVARFEIPERWKLKEQLHLFAPKDKSVDAHLKDYDDAYKAFYPKYVKAVMQGKNAEQIFELYKSEMNDTLTKLNVLSALPEFKRIFKTNTENDFKDPKLQQKTRASVDFLKDLMNKKDLADDEFFDFCAADGADSLRFISAFNPIMDKIRNNKLNEENLFDKDGKFRSAYELMQLTVAPSCINQENRKPLPEFTCNEGYDTVSSIKKKAKSKEEQYKMLREKVVLSLVQGYGVGNSFMSTATTGHINTIVGMRFNKELNRCEYLIRESQTGSSGWSSEDHIFSRINALAEVRRAK